MAWTAPRTWTTGELVSAALLNTHVRDNLVYIKGLFDPATGHNHGGAGDAGAQIGADGIAEDAVDDSKVGARVLALVKRQGGDAAQWGAPGTTTYTPGAVLVQAGSVTWAETPYVSGLVEVTFPVPFSSPPLVFCQAALGDVVAYPFVGTITKNQFTAYWGTWTGNKESVDIFWLAVGAK